MASDRLSIALERGLFELPEGRIAVFGARGPSDLAALPRDRTVVSVPFRPAYDALADAGWQVTADNPDAADLAVVFVDRARDAAEGDIARAASLGGPVVIDGAKTDGIEGLLRALRTRGEVSEALSKAHGKLAVLSPGADLADWTVAAPTEIADGFVTLPGVFSADGVDPGSALLVQHLPEKLGARIADLGAGWGYLARHILERGGVKQLHLVEADKRALDCARRNVTDPRAVFHWADATGFRDAEGFDAVVTNPPFHAGRHGDPSLGAAFIDTARRVLRRHGTLWLVANRHLPYEKTLSRSFGVVDEIGGDRSYKLFRAQRPRMTERRRP